MGKLSGHCFLLPWYFWSCNAYRFCVQIVRKEHCFNIVFFFSTSWKFYGLNLYYTGRYCCLEYVKKWILKILVISSFCRGRAVWISQYMFSLYLCSSHGGGGRGGGANEYRVVSESAFPTTTPGYVTDISAQVRFITHYLFLLHKGKGMVDWWSQKWNTQWNEWEKMFKNTEKGIETDRLKKFKKVEVDRDEGKMKDRRRGYIKFLINFRRGTQISVRPSSLHWAFWKGKIPSFQPKTVVQTSNCHWFKKSSYSPKCTHAFISKFYDHDDIISLSYLLGNFANSSLL